jgi:hypothetical protein
MNNTFSTLVRADWHGLAIPAGAERSLCGASVPVATSRDAAGLRPVSPRQVKTVSNPTTTTIH